LILLASSLACSGCGWGIDSADAKHKPPPEIPGEKEMNLQIKGSKH
jgi:hypothetical protein